MTRHRLPDDNRPLHVNIVAGTAVIGPGVSPPVRWAPGRDIEIHLSPYLPLRPGHDGMKLARLVLAYGREARTIRVRGGDPSLRESVARLLATAYGSPAVLVLWDDPRRPGGFPQPVRRSRPREDTNHVVADDGHG